MSVTVDYQIIDAFKEKGFECVFYGYGKMYDWENHVDIPCADYVKVEQKGQNKSIVHLHIDVLNHFQSKEYREKKNNGKTIKDCVMWKERKRGHIDIPDDLKALCGIQIQRLVDLQKDRLRVMARVVSIRNENY